MLRIFSSDLCLYIRDRARPRINAKEVKIINMMLIDWQMLEYIPMKASVLSIGAIMTIKCIRLIPAKRPKKR